MSKTKHIRWGMLCSHHPPAQYNRTYNCFGIRICARCLGIWIGSIVGYFLLIFFSVNLYTTLVLTYISAFCFMNYLFQEINKIENSNFFRTFTGILLGIGIGYHLHIVIHYQTLILMFAYFGGLIFYTFLVVWVLARYKRIDDIVNVYEEGLYEN